MSSRRQPRIDAHGRALASVLLAGTAAAFAALLLAAAPVHADPFDQVNVDGVIAADTLDWYPGDLVADDKADDDLVARTGNIRHLWLTWDAENLYLGIDYQDIGALGLQVWLDLQRGDGVRDIATVDGLAHSLLMPEGHLIELLLAHPPAGNTDPAVLPVASLVDDAGQLQPLAEATIAQGSTYWLPGKSRFALMAEVAIPWSALYPGLATTVPPLAAIKAVAVIRSSDAATDGMDSAPSTALPPAGAGARILENLAVSVVDRDGDGEPDPSHAALGGSVTVPAELGDVEITAEAELLDWSGRALGAPLSRFTGRPAGREFLLPRLPAGQYRVTVRARGALPASTTATVSEDERRLDLALALQRATEISGTVGFASGPGAAGTLRLLDDQGDELDRLSFPAAGGPFTFYVAEGGAYRLEATAATYATTVTNVAVTAGSDVTGLQVVLIRQAAIRGTVAFASGPGAAGELVLKDATGARLASRRFLATGGSFEFFVPADGAYTMEASAPTYRLLTVPVMVAGGQDVEGLELRLERLPRVRGAIAFEGPAAPGRVLVAELGGAVVDSTLFAAADDTFSFFLAPGLYELTFLAAGYVTQSRPASPAAAPVLDLGTIGLVAVRATRLVLVDETGREIAAVTTTVSLPAQDLYYFAPVRVAAWDDAGRADLYDLDGRLQSLILGATKLDDVSPPRGQVRFLGSPDLDDPITEIGFQAGRAEFWLANDAVEILRVTLTPAVPENPAARLMVSFRDPQPEAIVLTADRPTLVADGEDRIVVTGQLYDSAGNQSRLAGVPLGFGVLPSSAGRGQFEVGTVLTNADGLGQAVLSATGSGTLLVTASGNAAGVQLRVEAGGPGSPDSVLVVTALPGAVAGWRLSAAATAGLSDPLPVTAQLVDAQGNPSPQADVPIELTVDPSDRGAFDQPSAVSDAEGRVRASFLPAGSAGAVRLGGVSSGLAVEGVDVQLQDILVATDPSWDQELRTRQTFAATDLTAVVVDNDAENLLLSVPFASSWAGLQLHVILETNFDAAGGTQDAFLQPVSFAHADLPDYILTTKYSANDYGDFRRWSGTAWQWWNIGTQTWTSNTEGNSVQAWVAKGAEAVDFRIPLAVFGAAGLDSLRLEVYLTQEDAGSKRSAFDSVPSDSTLNLDFPPDSPDPADWARTTQNVTLHAWSHVYRLDLDFPPPPLVSRVSAAPAELAAGALFTLTADIADGGAGVGDVLADLSAMGGSPLARMWDDGRAEHGDAATGDGTYSLRAAVPLRSPGGALTLRVRAYDAGNETAAFGETTVEVAATIEAIVHAEDETGDDHGPNQSGVEKKYYTYPTSSVFAPGAFDLRTLDIYETVAVVGGVPVEMLAFEMKVGDFPDPAQEGNADWNPPYADINIQKIDILIDSAPGGATASLPNRQTAVQRWDAWEYAIIVDGWYKAVVPSLGQNTVEAWRANARRADRDIVLTADPALDTITALVSKEALGNPTPDDVRRWDVAVMMLGHDGEADFGGVRRVGDTRWEWGFGGGDYTDRDSNAIDLLLVPGTGKSPGRPQSELLDYGSAEALQRLDDGLTPVAVEATAFEDTGPPVIRIERNQGELVGRDPLLGAPLSLALRITDDWRVEGATFRYRPAGLAGAAWSEETPMGYLGQDTWGVDILPSWLDDNLTYSPVDSSRYVEFEIEANDPLAKTSRSSIVTMRIAPAATCVATAAAPGPALRHVDGSYLDLGQGLTAYLVGYHRDHAWAGEPDSLAAHLSLDWSVCVPPPASRSAPAVPDGRPLGIFREVGLQTRDDLGGVVPIQGRQPVPFQLGLHYPQDWVPAGLDEQKIAIYEYHPAADRWVFVGGHVNPRGNLVTANVDHAGIYGLFAGDDLDYDPDEVVSGIAVSPNPFSPNGDGLYDEAMISFYLSREATVTAEIYNIDGKRERIMTQNFPFSAEEQSGSTQPRRVAGLIWDGKNFDGDDLPYGIYVLRLLVTYNQAGGSRTVRSNHAVVLIR